MKQNSRFRHESLQSTESIKTLLKALTNGLAKGKIVFEDGDQAITLEPEGLLHFKLSANQEDDRNNINLKISWQGEQTVTKNNDLKISVK